jgi:hypothetical protein
MNRSIERYDLPECLKGCCEKVAYLRWLSRKAQAHLKRDRKRYGRQHASGPLYKSEIHRAVQNGGNRDYYTNRSLDWSLISKYDNDEAKAGRSEYLTRFAHLPTVDHTLDANGRRKFVICSWRVNDAKSHLPEADFLDVCEQVLAHRRSKSSAAA